MAWLYKGKKINHQDIPPVWGVEESKKIIFGD
jgi:hypothetical protein